MSDENWMGVNEFLNECKKLHNRLDDISKSMMGALSAINDRVCALQFIAGGSRAAQAEAPVVKDPSNVNLDDDHGNFAIRRDPPRWIAANPDASQVGKRLSECSLPYLEAYKAYRIWGIGMDEAKATPQGAKYAEYGRLDVKRIEGWIQRKRANPARVYPLPPPSPATHAPAPQYAPKSTADDLAF